MKYKVSIRREALKELLSLPTRDQEKLGSAIDDLAFDPRPSGCKKLKGEHMHFWRIRVGNYRVIYQVDDTIKVVEVGKIGHRKSVYD